ncbi:MAG: ABC transporter ATP-binding protein [Chloroflexi bacterium HGW-Chloroflexi-10]|nr:MAG: ABC transporter ATP-binding protein [Chloroflexi bacterium HGW-Chloroflexi-10]
MIRTERLTKYFDQFLAVDQVSLDVPDGEILVLLGPNGAGKTTTVRMLTSILRPSSGHAFVAGYDVVKNAKKVREVVGVLTEHHGLYGRMNAEEYLQFFGALYGLSAKDSIRRFEPLLEQFGMISYRKQRLGEYSKGMRQKLALVRALINDPPVLLLDEPTSAMDPESARMVRNAIHGLRNNQRTIILCTHNLSEAEELADQVAIIRRGKIVLNESLAEVKRTLLGNPVYEAVFVNDLDSWKPELPAGIHALDYQANSIKFEIENPANANPEFLKYLATQKNLLTFHEIPRRLEDAYLEAVNLVENGGL